MFSYKWNDEQGKQWKAEFFGAWKRLNSCRAATLHKKPKMTGDKNWTCEESFLVSYCTAIGYVGYYRPNAEYEPQLVIGLSDEFNCSATTRKHVGKWLQVVTLFTTIPIGSISYGVLRDAMKQMQKKNVFSVQIDETTSLVRLTQKELFHLMGNDKSDVLTF